MINQTINPIMIKQLVLYLKDNQGITEQDFLIVMSNTTGHSNSETLEWYNVFLNGLHESFILTEPTFDYLKLKSKEILIEEIDIKVSLFERIINDYLINHPLQYLLQIELDKINNEIELVSSEPDEILMPNDSKIIQLDLLNQDKSEVLKWLQ